MLILDENYAKFYAILIEGQTLGYSTAECFGGGKRFGYIDSHPYHKGTSRAIHCTDLTYSDFVNMLMTPPPGGRASPYALQNWANATFYIEEREALSVQRTLYVVKPPHVGHGGVPPPSLEQDWASWLKPHNKNVKGEKNGSPT